MWIQCHPGVSGMARTIQPGVETGAQAPAPQPIGCHNDNTRLSAQHLSGHWCGFGGHIGCSQPGTAGLASNAAGRCRYRCQRGVQPAGGHYGAAHFARRRPAVAPVTRWRPHDAAASSLAAARWSGLVAYRRTGEMSGPSAPPTGQLADGWSACCGCRRLGAHRQHRAIGGLWPHRR